MNCLQSGQTDAADLPASSCLRTFCISASLFPFNASLLMCISFFLFFIFHTRGSSFPQHDVMQASEFEVGPISYSRMHQLTRLIQLFKHVHTYILLFPLTDTVSFSGRQTDATVVNIFWPWDQLLRPAGGLDKPHRMAQPGLIEADQAAGALLSLGQRAEETLVLLIFLLCSENNTSSRCPVCSLQVVLSSVSAHFTPRGLQ